MKMNAGSVAPQSIILLGEMSSTRDKKWFLKSKCPPCPTKVERFTASCSKTIVSQKNEVNPMLNRMANTSRQFHSLAVIICPGGESLGIRLKINCQSAQAVKIARKITDIKLWLKIKALTDKIDSSQIPLDGEVLSLSNIQSEVAKKPKLNVSATSPRACGSIK